MARYPHIGHLRARAEFYRRNETRDDYGNVSSGWTATPFLRVWAGLEMERGRERIEAGRLESAVSGVLTVRFSTETRAITAADKVRIGGEDYAIRTITDPDRRRRFLEMVVERGVTP